MPLMPLPEALERALSIIRPLEPVSLPLEAALGLFLAEPVFAVRDVPGCDNSAMDGFALRASETTGANRDRPARFDVVETIYAGHAPSRALRPGQAARIFTGAPVPEGADCVVRQEAAALMGAQLEVFVTARVGEHIRRRGEEAQADAPLFVPGQRVDAALAGVLASQGHSQVRVHRAVRTAVVVVGDELLPPGTEALSHQIYDSNRVLISLMAKDANAEIVHTARCGDDPATLSQALGEALERCEVLITCGGASVGDRDLVKGVLRELGADFVVDGVALKPGKPVAVGSLAGKVVVVLPGNPGAATVAFDQLARPLLLGLQGTTERRRRVRVRMDSARRKQAALTYLLSAILEERDGVPWAKIRPQGAGQQLQNVAMDGWVVLPAGRAEFGEGEWAELELVHGARYAALSERDAQTALRSPLVVSVVGWSDSGKTTLIERLIPELRAQGLEVAVLKRSAHPHPLHKPGSDTERFAAAGARSTALSTPSGFVVTSNADVHQTLETLTRLGGAEVILVEGWKTGPLPKIVVGEVPDGVDPGAVIAQVTTSDPQTVSALVQQLASLRK